MDSYLQRVLKELLKGSDFVSATGKKRPIDLYIKNYNVKKIISQLIKSQDVIMKSDTSKQFQLNSTGRRISHT